MVLAWPLRALLKYVAVNTGLVRKRFNEVKRRTQCLAHSSCSINVCFPDVSHLAYVSMCFVFFHVNETSRPFSANTDTNYSRLFLVYFQNPAIPGILVPSTPK